MFARAYEKQSERTDRVNDRFFFYNFFFFFFFFWFFSRVGLRLFGKGGG